MRLGTPSRGRIPVLRPVTLVRLDLAQAERLSLWPCATRAPRKYTRTIFALQRCDSTVTKRASVLHPQPQQNSPN